MACWTISARERAFPAKVLNDPAMAKDVEDIVAEVQALLVKVNAMAAELQTVVAKLPPMADTVAGEVDNLPVIIGEAQTLMRETDHIAGRTAEALVAEKIHGVG